MTPPLWSPLKRVFRRPSWSSGDSRTAVDEELSFHLEMAADEYREQGLDAEEARVRAQADFGNLEFTREYCAEQTALRETEARGVMRMEELFQDVVFSMRTLRKNWSYTVVVVATLAFGIAATTLIFSVMNPYFFRALPYQDAEHLVQLGQADGEWDGNRFSLGQIEDWKGRSQAFEDVGAYWYTSKNLTGSEGAVRAMATVMTDNLFDILGTAPLMGRTIRPGEGGPGGADVVVLSQGLWESRYGADTGILGRSVELDGVPHTVIGVMPHEFSFPFNEVRMWIPGKEDAASQGRTNDNYMPVGRLKADWTPERARTELTAIHAEFASMYPEQEGRYTGVSVKTLRAALNFAWDPLRVSFTVLLVAVLCVLLIACVNVASLTLARASTRAREVAVRAAVGAGRGRLVRQFLTESVVLALAGGLVGVGLAYWAAALLGPLIPEGLYRVGDVSIDGTVLAFTLVVTMITPVVFGLGPALSATKADLATTLKEGGGGSGRPGALRGRRVLVVAEVALAIALIAGTGLMIRSFASIQSVDVGFEPDRLVLAELSPSRYAYGTSEELEGFFQRATEEAGRIPGVTAVGQTAWLPLNHETLEISVARPGTEPADVNDWPRATRGYVSAEYFTTMGIPVAAGRTFQATDGADDADVVIISRLFQERHFAGENPVGQMLSVRGSKSSSLMRIVGVVGDIQNSNLEGVRSPFVYRPLTQAPARRRFIIARTEGELSAAAQGLRQAMQTVDPNLPVDIRIMGDIVQENTLVWALGSVFLGIFGIGALLLASLGIYGVVSYSVTQRRREMGIRIAMGASSRSIRSTVVTEGLKLTGMGLAFGLLLALAVGRLMASILFGVSPFDPMTLLGVAALFAAVATVASAVPAIRAGRVDPIKVLRIE